MNPTEEFSSTYLSVIVPVLNEEGSVASLYAEILEVCRKIGKPFEIIFVDDGSTDRTADALRKLAPIRLIRLRRNFGQTAAMDAGIKAAKGRYLATLDGDGQNDPADIPRLIAKLEADGLDIVSGWRKHRQDTSSKRYASLAAAMVRKFLIDDGIHDSGCSLKVYKKECFARVTLYGESHRFIPAILKIKGFTVGEEVVNHRPRKAGHTKYNWQRGIKGVLDMFAVWFWQKYSARPLHLFGTVGLSLMLLSFVSGAYAISLKVFGHQDLSNTSLTELSMFGFFTAVLLIVFGLIADMLSRIYFGATVDRSYEIKEIIDNNS